MGSYNLHTEFGPSGENVISVDPYWVVAVYPWARHITFDRTKFRNPSNMSVSTSNDISATARVKNGEPVIMYQDCTSMQVTGSKANHVMTMTATFLESGQHYMSKVFDGDWCMSWIVYGEDKLQDLLKRIKQGQPCNGFEDGFKFLGKVLSFRKNLSIQESGAKKEQYNLQALGFSEFANMLFYDTRLQQTSPFFADLVGKLNIAIEQLMSFDRNQGIDTNKFVPLALDLILGSGVSSGFANPSGSLPIASGPVQSPKKSDEPKVAYVVPKEVGALLGRTNPTSQVGLLSYADLLDVVVGIQQYQNQTRDFKVFVPRGADTKDKRKLLGKSNSDLALLGSFLPIPLPFTNKPLWALLNQFLNPVINEMYTVLRVNSEGKVVPTLIVRQIPFTSDAFAGASGSPLDGPIGKAPTLTRFLELPRWKVDPVLVKTYDVGRSGQAWFNFVHVYGEPVVSQPLTDITSQIVRSPPLCDEEDCRRHGIKPFMATVACSPEDAAGDGPKIWKEVAADFHMGTQFFFNGSVGLLGITAPICHGDNLEWDDVVYHIESVSHSCAIAEDGRKQFRTYLALSHGVRSDSSLYGVNAAATGLEDPGRTSTESLEDLRVYPGLNPEDNTAFSPGHGGDMNQLPGSTDNGH